MKKFNWRKIKLDDVTTFLLMWLFGVGLFYFLIMMSREKFNFQIAWENALLLSIGGAFFWSIIGAALTAHDEKMAAGREAISETVAKWFKEKNL